MIVDTSAIVAILLREPERETFIERLIDGDAVQMSAATVTEVSVVLLRKNQPALIDEFERLVDEFSIAVQPHTHVLARRTRAAFATFGQGTGHRARLNFGDCFTYALAAAAAGEPILCKAEDFVHTDLPVVPV